MIRPIADCVPSIWTERPYYPVQYLPPGRTGHRVTTLEGVAKEAEEFARFMAVQGAEQCGYCSPGFIMNVLAMARELKNPTEQEIKEYLAGNLCRCTGYEGQYRAIRNYLGATRANYQLFEKGEVIEGVR